MILFIYLFFLTKIWFEHIVKYICMTFCYKRAELVKKKKKKNLLDSFQVIFVRSGRYTLKIFYFTIGSEQKSGKKTWKNIKTEIQNLYNKVCIYSNTLPLVGCDTRPIFQANSW